MVGELTALVRHGGVTMVPLLALAVAAAAVFVERVLAVRRARIGAAGLLPAVRQAVLIDRDARKAIALCEAAGGPIASVVKAALSRLGRPAEEIERGIESAVAFESARLERGLPLLAATANVAPLIGFLGTVMGMMKAFGAFGQTGLANPAIAGSGVSEALTAAAAGLLVAIPAQLGHTYLSSLVDRTLGDIVVASDTVLETVAELESGHRPAGAASGG
jgi:biopolymer transport protein ExbB